MSPQQQLNLKMKATELYAKFLWPVHRRFLRGKLKKRCVKCAMSEAATPLDSAGFCGPCTSALDSAKPASKNEDLALDQVFQSTGQTGALGFDAAVLFSGGKDSIFLVSELQRRYPNLRIVAFLMDNGFMSPVALENAEKAVAKLNVEYYKIRPSTSLYREFSRRSSLIRDSKIRDVLKRWIWSKYSYFTRWRKHLFSVCKSRCWLTD